MGFFDYVINYEIFKSISSVFPFYMFLIIVSLIFASTLTIPSVSNKLKFGYLILISILGGSFLLMIFYYLISILNISISITGIIIGFIILLGIMMIILLSSKKEHLTLPNVEKIGSGKSRTFEYKMKQQPNKIFTESKQKTPLVDGTVCIALHENGSHYFTNVKDGVCGTFKSKYGDQIDGINNVEEECTLYGNNIDGNNIDGNKSNSNGEKSNNQYGLGVGTDGIISNGDLEEQKRKSEEELKEMEKQVKTNIKNGLCTSNENGNCVDINNIEEEGFNPKEYMIDYCRSKCGDFCGLSNSYDNMKSCCIPNSDPSGQHTLNIDCKRGTFNGVTYSPSEVMSMTKCLPLTSDFNYSCQYANPPCSQFKDESSCGNAKGQCIWNVDSNGNSGCYLSKSENYKFGNYIPQDFGYKTILKGIDGNCPNTYGRAICSPDYYSGVRKVENSTSCKDMESTDFVDSCIDNYGYNQDKVSDSNSYGCSPNQTRKICKKNKAQPIKYVGCYVTDPSESTIMENTSSAMECINACNADSSNKYAAITKGNQCTCSKSFVNFVKQGSNDCNIPCDTGFTRNCGGSNASSVYKL